MITERVRKTGHPHEFGRIDLPERPVEAVHTPERQNGPVVYYVGTRIYFRPLELEDEPLLRRWINDPRVWRYLLHRGPISATREREWIESLTKTTTDYIFGIVTRDGDRLIGTVGLHGVDPVGRIATFGVMIGDVDYQNQGYGTEATKLALKYAFQELNLNRVQLSVFGNNWRAIRVYQKVGFTHEGCLRQAVYRNGQYQDEYRFAILREEWNRLANVEIPNSAYLDRLNH